MAGGVLHILGELMDVYNFVLVGVENYSAVAGTAPIVVENLLFLLGTVLVLFGLFGLYERQSDAAGPLGVVGFLVAFLGTALAVGASWVAVFIDHLVAAEAPALLDAGPPLGLILSYGIFAVGWLLFGVATLRAHIYPRWAALLLMVGAVLGFFPLPLSTVVFGVAVAWLGFALFTGRDTSSAEHAQRVR